MILRVYLSQAAYVLRNARAGNVVPGLGSLQAVLKNEDDPVKLAEQIALALAQRAEAADLGLGYVVGFRVAESFTHPISCCQQSFWDSSARALRAIREAGFSDVAIDAEAYQLTISKIPSLATLTQYGRTHAQLIGAMASFLAEIALMPRVRIYPGNAADLVVMAIAGVSGPAVELWLEDFGAATLAIRDPHASEHHTAFAARGRTTLAKAAPWAIVRSGDTDALLRDVGGEMRERRMLDYGPEAPWIFLRQRADEIDFGTPSWLRATALGCNDTAHVWSFASATEFLSTTRTSSAVIVSERVPRESVLSSDHLSSAGFVLRAGVYFRASKVLPPIGDFSIVFHGASRLDGPVFGASQPNCDSWAIWRQGEVLVLRVRSASGPEVRSYPVGPAATKAIVVVRRGTTFEITTDGGAVVVAPEIIVRLHAGSVYVGAAGTPASASAWTISEGVAVEQLEVFHRALSPAEAVACLATYPRGIS